MDTRPSKIEKQLKGYSGDEHEKGSMGVVYITPGIQDGNPYGLVIVQQ